MYIKQEPLTRSELNHIIETTSLSPNEARLFATIDQLEQIIYSMQDQLDVCGCD
jgi:hypothetical protein